MVGRPATTERVGWGDASGASKSLENFEVVAECRHYLGWEDARCGRIPSLFFVSNAAANVSALEFFLHEYRDVGNTEELWFWSTASSPPECLACQ
jgi:hypothetical protein